MRDLLQPQTKPRNVIMKYFNPLMLVATICSAILFVTPAISAENNEGKKKDGTFAPIQKYDIDHFFEEEVSTVDALPEEKQFSSETKEVLDNIKKSLRAEKKNPIEKLSISHGYEEYSALEDEESEEVQDVIGVKKPLDISISDASAEDVDNTNDIINMASEALVIGQVEVATSLYKKALKEQPYNKDALFGLGAAYQRNGQEKQARKTYAKLLKIAPNHREALSNFLALTSKESPEAALIELKNIERTSPKFDPVVAQIALLHNKMGHTDKAIKYFSKAVKMAPSNIKYRYNLAVLLDRSGRHMDAIPLYRDLIKSGLQGMILPTTVANIHERLTFLSVK